MKHEVSSSKQQHHDTHLTLSTTSLIKTGIVGAVVALTSLPTGSQAWASAQESAETLDNGVEDTQSLVDLWSQAAILRAWKRFPSINSETISLEFRKGVAYVNGSVKDTKTKKLVLDLTGRVALDVVDSLSTPSKKGDAAKDASEPDLLKPRRSEVSRPLRDPHWGFIN